MKKLLLFVCVGMLIAVTAGCGGKDDQGSGSGEPTQQPTAGSATDSQEQDDKSTPAPTPVDNNYEEGWTEEMQAVRDAVAEKLGDSYWPNSPIMPDMLESIYGIAPDMYLDYFGEMPMISTNVDTLIVVRATEDKAQDVEDALLAYYDKNVNDSMQYPMNVGKIQAARVERVGDYVLFVQLGGDTTEVSAEGDQDLIIAHCKEVNELVIEIISGVLQN